MKKKNLKKLLGIVLCLFMFTSVFVGCSENKEQKENSKASNEESKKIEAEKENKTLIMASGGELNTLYPLNMDIQNNLASKQVYEGLVSYEDGKVVPSLAESWEFNNDGTKLTFHLREGVKFHDGTEFNAEVVKTDYDFARKNPNFGSVKALVNAKSIDVIDENTVMFTYSEPYFAYLSHFCHPDVMAIVSPEVIEEGNFQNMKGVVGTGPYVYKKFKNGEYAKLVKNENYWGEKPYYDEIIIKYIPESSSRLQALQKGEIDIIYGNELISWDDYNQATGLDHVKGLVSEYESKTNNLLLNASSENLCDKKVREAIAYAIDKKSISEGLTYGNETVADTLFPKGTPYTNFEMNIIRKFNKDKANALLEEDGWNMNSSTNIREKEGRPLTLLFTYHSGEVYNKSLATVLKSQLSEIGIDLKTEGKDMMSWWKDGVAGKYDLTIWNTERTHTNPHGFFTPMVNRSPHVPSIANLEGKDEFIETINKFQTMKDGKEVVDIFKYLINYSNDNVIDIPLTYGKDIIIYNSDKIDGYNFTSTPMFFDATQLKAK